MNDYQIAKLKRIVAFMDKSIADNNRLIEAQRNRPVFKERAEAYADGIDLVNGDMEYIRKWIAEVIDDN
jgi:elongation factor P--beta-lysine ligase